MTYSTSNPPKLLVGSFTNNASEPAFWTYSGTDTAATVDGSGFITNVKSLGMKIPDVVIHNNTTSNITTIHRVVAINTNGSADLSDFGASISTNSD
jgi:hypothetical protein